MKAKVNLVRLFNILIIYIVFFKFNFVFSEEPQAKDLSFDMFSGYYSVVGTTPDSTKYRGVLYIRFVGTLFDGVKPFSKYLVIWALEDGSTTRGILLYDHNSNHGFVSFMQPIENKYVIGYGLVVKKDNKLNFTWFVGASSENGSEIWDELVNLRNKRK
ncbi:MAG: hypothetical protein QXH92_03850 [Candidatus Aenigmatarchaeota archaeon]